MNSAQEFEKIKQAIAHDLEEQHKAKGRISLLKEELKKLGLGSKAEAEAELARLREAINKDQEELDILLAAFKEKYGTRLQSLGR